MKFSLTISDATKEEIAAFLGGNPSGLAGLGIPGNTIVDQPPGMNNPGTQNVADDDSAPTNVNAPAVDSAGLPHDPRIHSDNKGLNKDGSWRKRRGVNDAMVAAVEAELKARVNITLPPPHPQFSPPSSQVPMPQQQYQQPQYAPPMPDQQMPQQFQQQPQYAPPSQPQFQQQPAATMDFNGFMMHLSGQMQKRDQTGQPLITTDYLASIAQRLSAQFQRQFNSITDIASDQNAINAAVAFISGDGRWN